MRILLSNFDLVLVTVTVATAVDSYHGASTESMEQSVTWYTEHIF